MAEIKTLAPIDQVRGLLGQLRGQLELALPAVGLTADRLVRVALTSCQTTPRLLECDRRSLLGAIVKCAQVGLVPDGVTGEAYLIPYGGQVQFQLGYKGISVLVRRSGEVDTFLPQVVYDGDIFEYNLAEARITRHERTKATDYDSPSHFYTIVKYRSGVSESLVMTKDEVDHVRDNFSKAWATALKNKKEDESIWALHYEAMGMKTVMRKHAKYLPFKTDDMAMRAKMAIVDDEKGEAGVSQNLANLVPGGAAEPEGETAPAADPARPKLQEPKEKVKGSDIPFGD